MECLWDLLRSIPSLEVENASVLDEFYWLQKDDPHRSLRRMTQNRGQPVPTDGKYTLSSRAQLEMNLLSITRDEDLYDKGMNEFLGKDFAKWQLPDSWAFIDKVPRTSVGKFDKKVIRKWYADEEITVEKG